jgi:hypothetical protein
VKALRPKSNFLLEKKEETKWRLSTGRVHGW